MLQAIQDRAEPNNTTMTKARNYNVEVINPRKGDTEMEKDFRTYNGAVNYAKRHASLKGMYIFIYVPKNDGFSDYFMREDWTGGRHNVWHDEEIF